ncbi:MAG TPA: hypothetical protein VIG94_02715 [Faecalibacter sp.]|uniref:hypothetical protein n=1 Tax=Faecalibacter sp. LW9 TaxID=3103144 RepID=UPI002AFE116C|nr:hypothetical protein [Faecalibacter sp. LW9]
MKKLFYIIVFMGGIANAQVAIGKEDVTNESILLEFDDNESNTLGIILPSVLDASSITAQNGTFLFDVATKKVRMYENSAWKDLSAVGDDSAVIIDPSSENTNSTGVILGSDTTATPGVFVLEATDKAMVLPKIANPHLTVESPYAGMMCYDTVSKSLAVFDGANWNYWK